MKLNGTDNIITDLDVTVTGNKHLGNSLRTVIDELDDKVQDLEEQTKWIYANGGVGSGGGGGGGSTKWAIKATLDNVEITSGGTISLSSGSGNYVLRLYTSGGSDTYSVTYTYGNNISRTITLNADNGWSASVSLRITENGRISVTASDGKIRREITGCNYIVVPYTFGQPALFRDDGSAYPSGNSDIFVEEAHDAGINIVSTYAIAVSGEFLYAWYMDGEIIQDWQPVESNSGKLTYAIPRDFIVNENAALHSYELRTSARPDGTLEPVVKSLNGSFNLIPRDLYLKISPNEGQMIYDTNTILDPYTFSTNNKIGLFVRIYNGANATGKAADIKWTTYAADGTKETEQTEKTTDGVTNSITVYFSKPGWNYTVFEYSLEGQVGTPVTKYFYCEESSSSYNWFVDGHAPAERRWYIAQAKQGSGEVPLSGITNIASGSTIPLYIEKKSSDLDTEYHINTYTANDQMINIGIQYSDINNVQNPILRFYSDENKAQPAITLYQDKIVFGNRFFSSEQATNIFLKKETNYDPDNRDQYHIISINVASCFYIRQAEEGLLPNNTYYEISIYIDGKLEGTVNTKSTVSPELHILELFGGNYAINQIDIARFSASDGNRIIYDSDVNWYWNSFKERVGDTIDRAETAILAELFDPNNNNAPTFSIEHDLVKVTNAFPSNVAMNANVPVMVLTCARDIVWSGGDTDIYNWMNQSYVDGQIGLNKVTIDLQNLEWSHG